MLNYTYRYMVQGNTSHYVELAFDRILSPVCAYRMNCLRPVGQPKVCELMDAIAATPNVIRDPDINAVNHAELIHVTGNSVLVKVAGRFGDKTPVELVNQIVKKVQRRFAKGESRKRRLFKQVEAAYKRRNLKTWGPK